MRFLTYLECAEWCSNHGFPTRQFEGHKIRPVNQDLQSPPFHFVEFPHPADSGRKVWLARYLYSLVRESPELLMWISDWDIWPSCQHMPLFTRFRQALGEQRQIHEAPGHLVTPDEADDAISIISVSLLFIWNCHVFCASGRDAVFTSHDEYGWFASRDESVVESVRGQMEKESVTGAEANAG